MADKLTGIDEGVLTEEQKKRATIIHSLFEIQKEHNYLPEEELKKLSEKLNIPLADIYSTASFYKQFYLQPRGKNVVCVCVGTACHVNGAPEVLEVLENTFGIKAGETDKDLNVTLETVGCVGCCGLAPVVTLNEEEIIGEVTKEKAQELADRVWNKKN
ncbi:NAD(P)H-dependent oxidoreductase subunit E [Peptococcaceae bacterium]|nr:NAD(P)H-dependent oxidoreductase subunit E [Peptococcaceae bacterium]MCL0107715.1 NAD(P)H-dependent oxidoreductase subunit E [Peptococcaceae bacterium]